MMNLATQVLYLSEIKENFEGVKGILEGSSLGNFQVTGADSWNESKARFLESEVSIVLTDLEVNGLGRHELFKAIREANSKIPIVVVTSSIREEEALAAMKGGEIKDYVLLNSRSIERLPWIVQSAVEAQRFAEARTQLEKQIEELRIEIERRDRDWEAKVMSAAKELEAFAYSVSHDLRAPLRAIEGFSRILVDDYSAQLDSDAQRCLNIVITSASQMSRLIEEVLTFSRVSQAPLNRECLNMQELVQIVSMEVRQAEKNCRAEFQIDNLLSVEGDAPLLRKAFTHLIANAVKFSRPKAEPEIQIESYREGSEIVFCIKDNGVGFDMRYSNKLFSMFQRLHRAEDFEGNGSGLAIVKRIIQRHGGRTWGEATPGQGAKFFISLPAPAGCESKETA